MGTNHHASQHMPSLAWTARACPERAGTFLGGKRVEPRSQVRLVPGKAGFTIGRCPTVFALREGGAHDRLQGAPPEPGAERRDAEQGEGGSPEELRPRS